MGDLTRPDWSGRLRRVWRTPPADVCALVVSTPSNITYLTGFSGSAGVFLSTPVRNWLLVDGRYAEAARQARSDGRLADIDVVTTPGSIDGSLAQLLGSSEVPAGVVGFEAGHVTVAMLRGWERMAANRRFEATTNWIEQLRSIKDADEVRRIRRSCDLLSGVARELVRWVRPGRGEREIAEDIDGAMRRAGLTRPAFETIVASGPHSAYPHARPTDRRLQEGDLVVLDFGGVIDGYCVDLTRMAAIGRIESAADSLYTAVRDAQSAALKAVGAGVRGSAVDDAARQVLEARGLGAAFLHGTGHGLGLEVHEAPRLARADSGAPDVLEAGMVCTIEPGAYVNGVGGVRLEDDVLVTAGGREVLTNAPRDLIRV